MSETRYHLAQANIARMRAPLKDPLMADFAARIPAMNALAEGSPGFVWRMQDESGNNTALHAFNDPNLLFNLSVWTSVEALHAYVYDTAHREPMDRRAEWFFPLDGPHLALWWIRPGRRPTVEEAKARIDLLNVAGPSALAFTFRQSFPAPPTSPFSAGDIHQLRERCNV